jgi:hypothetical protein
MERKSNLFRNFDIRLVTRDAHAGNFLFLTFIFVQYTFIPLLRGALNLIDQAFILVLFGMLVVLNLLGVIYYRLQSANVGSSFILIFSTALLVYMGVYYNGLFNALVFGIVVFLIIMNIFGMVMNGRLYWNIPRRGMFFTKLDWTRHNGRKVVKIVAVTGILFALAVSSYYSFWLPITVRPADGAKTTSSYWGPITMSTSSCTSTITPATNTTLMVNNASLSNDPSMFVNGSLAWITSVAVVGNIFNYCNYSKGAKSYPNGSVFLSTALPLVGTVNVTFMYVTNWAVLQGLSIGESTIILNYNEDAYFNTAHFFDAIQYTYLFQLLDYWQVKYYLNVNSGAIDAANVFNYLDTIPRCYRMLNWMLNMSGDGFCKKFIGISLDMEGGDHAVPVGNPGGSTLPPFQGLLPNGTGDIPGNEFLDTWYRSNEQNRTLYQQALDAYEGVYQYAAYLGKNAYIVLGWGEMHDILDGDIDTGRIPVMPRGDKNVYFGIMSYEDSMITGGRFQVYRDCVEQQHFFGQQGRSILLGWLGYDNIRWYTSDEQGFQNYINDCLIAQATGITEIFTAPLNSLQVKWGDDCVLRLHNALNVDPKRTISFTPGPWRSDLGYIPDFAKNFNYPWVFAMYVLLLFAWVVAFGMVGKYRRPIVTLMMI